MITITLAPCPGVDNPFAAVTKETVAFVGADVPDGLQVALFDGSGTCLAVADIKDAQAELDLDTQEAVDATTPAAPGEAVTAWLVVGNKETHIATLPCKLIRNLIDDGAVHPSVPAERYPTVDELAKWLEEAGVIAAKAVIAAGNAQAAAQAAGQKADEANQAAKTATSASTSAEAAKKAAETAKQVAQEAKQGATTAAGNADASAKEAKAQADKANESAEAAAKSAESVSGVVEDVKAQVDRLAQTAQEAEGAIGDLASGAAKSAEAAAYSAEAAARYADDVVDAKLAAAQSAEDAESAKAGAEEAKAGAEKAKQDAEAAKQGAESAKQGAESAKAAAEQAKTAAATSATNAAQSAEDAESAKAGAEEAKADIQANADRIGYGFVAPGSPLVIIGGDSTCFTLVKLVDDMADQRATCFISRTIDGGHWFAIASTRDAAKNAYHCYILDDDLKPEWEFWSEDLGGHNIPACVVVGELAFVKTQRRLMRFALDTDGTGTIEKQIVVGKPPDCARPHMAYNPKSGHLYLYQTPGFFVNRWDVYDLELNATGASFGQTQTSWFIFKGWLYGADETTLRRALADDTMVDVVPTDGSPLKWRTKASELGGTGDAYTCATPLFLFRGSYAMYDGIYKYAVTFGDEGEMILGPREESRITESYGMSGSFGFVENSTHWTYCFCQATKGLLAAQKANFVNRSSNNCFAFEAFVYSNPYTWQPMAFFDSKMHSFRVMMRGAVMVNLVPELGG